MTNTPLDRLRHHVTGAIERGEAEAIVEVTTKHYNYIDLGYGCKLIAPDGTDVFMQGDEYSDFDAELERAAENYKPSQTFPTFEDLQDALIDPYFC